MREFSGGSTVNFWNFKILTTPALTAAKIRLLKLFDNSVVYNGIKFVLAFFQEFFSGKNLLLCKFLSLCKFSIVLGLKLKWQTAVGGTSCPLL